MIAHIRAIAAMTLAAATAFAFAAVAAPRPGSAAPNDGCMQALAYEKTAASDSVTRQAAYDSAVAGLSANQRCADPQMRLVNEAYLLSMRAPAEHDLKIGDWRRDLARANMLLVQCTNWPGLRNTRAGTDCATQKRYNEIITKSLTAIPSAAPSARPAPPTPPAGGTAMPLPRPASPIPSPTPR